MGGHGFAAMSEEDAGASEDNSHGNNPVARPRSLWRGVIGAKQDADSWEIIQNGFATHFIMPFLNGLAVFAAGIILPWLRSTPRATDGRYALAKPMSKGADLPSVQGGHRLLPDHPNWT